ncbi:hypothetical protein FSP39_016047 [Pinctada imbricata]|uniref:phospholipase A2 n=1 Tax=Pinctada imbricata TaxID=66713 RepID=A0AA89BXA4_PINIB|nr:hypothetical protein FSP39_016047 [Pinctada imbricata]
MVDEKESLSQYHSFLSRLNAILSSSSGVYTEPKLQELCDTVRSYPTWTAAHIASHVGLFECFRNPDVSGQLNSMCTSTGITPLMAAVIGKQHHCAVELLKLAANIDAQDDKGDTVYHKAVEADPEIITILVDNDKVNVINWLNNEGFTALSIACKKSLPDVVHNLLENGAEPAITAHDILPIHSAVDNEDEKSVEEIIKKFPEQLTARDGKYGGTPVHWAKSRKMLDLLISYKADLDVRNLAGNTPLHTMLKLDRRDCVIGLLVHGADPSIANENGDTPLHLVVEKDDVELLRTFIVYNADVNKRNRSKHTARHIVATSKLKKKQNLLYMLHVGGCERCGTDVKGCYVGCSAEGNDNGEPDPETEKLLNTDVVGKEICPVLTLDGGGIRGLVTIQVLMALEKALGRPVGECFDWIGGTSTGGILAVGLALGKKLTYMMGMYMRLKDEVFQGKRPYSSERFEELLRQEIGEKMVMTDIKEPKVMLFGLMADRFPAEMHAFRSYEPTVVHEPKTPMKRNDSTDKKKKDKKDKDPEEQCFKPLPPHEQLIWKAVRSSGAAPTYFKASDAFLDGGLISNNPTLDVLTEIQEYNLGLKLKNRKEEVQDLGLVLSLGTGKQPKVYSGAFDVYMPEGLLDVTRVAQGANNLIKILVDQACLSEGRPVDRSRAWCCSLGVPFFRLNPKISYDIPLDTNDDKVLTKLMWDAQVYIVANKEKIRKIAELINR